MSQSTLGSLTHANISVPVAWQQGFETREIGATRLSAADQVGGPYSVFRLRRATAESKPETNGEGPADSIENEHYRATLNARTGEMTGLTVKSGDWQVFDAPANVVVRQHDTGDSWELYRPLDGGSRIAMRNPQPVSTSLFNVQHSTNAAL